MFPNDNLFTDSRKPAGGKTTTLFSLPRPAKSSIIKKFVVKFVVAATATGISLSLFIIVLHQLYRQYGGRTLI